MSSNNNPERAGLYLAKSDEYKWWNLIVDVQGAAPMLYIRYALDRSGPRLLNLKPFDIKEWGPRIEC